MMHQFVLSQAPTFALSMKKVCRSLPCPGFVWADASAFKAKATLAPDETLGLAKPTAVVELTNTSEYPQMLPVIELKYLDPAGSTLLQRVLEPADYGFPQKPAILPAGESLTAQIRWKNVLSFAATAAQVKPVVDATSPLRRASPAASFDVRQRLQAFCSASNPKSQPHECSHHRLHRLRPPVFSFARCWRTNNALLGGNSTPPFLTRPRRVSAAVPNIVVLHEAHR